jgi:hypothetical protein
MSTQNFLAQLIEDMLQPPLAEFDWQSGQNHDKMETKQRGDYAISLGVIIMSQALRRKG